MGVQVLTPGVKAAPWNVDVGRVAEEWRWFWSIGRDWEWLVPFWSGGGPIRDYAPKRKNGTYAIPSTSHSWSSTPHGIGVLDDGSGTGESVESIPIGITDETIFDNTHEWTAFAVGRPSVVTGDERAFFSKWGLTDERVLTAQVDPAEAGHPALQINVYDGSSNKLTGTTEVFTDRTYVMFVRAVSGGSTVEIWGWEIQPDFSVIEQGISFAHPGMNVDPGASEVKFGGRGGGGNRFLGDLLLEGYARRAFTPHQMRQIASDPFGPFRPAADRTVVVVGQTVSISGTSAGTSSDTGAPAKVDGISATGAGTSADTAAPTVSDSLTATGAGTSADTAAPTVSASLIATGAGTSTDTGAPATTAALTATGAGTSTDTATPTTVASISGTGAGTSTDTGVLTETSTVVQISGTSAGTSSDSGAASTTVAASGTSAGKSTDTALATLTVALTGTGIGTSTDTGTIQAIGAELDLRPPYTALWTDPARSASWTEPERAGSWTDPERSASVTDPEKDADWIDPDRDANWDWE